MQYLIMGMILAGSILMVYNIIRYSVFIKRNYDLEHKASVNWITIIPLLLLVFFLVGYVIIGISGIADLLTAAILLGGSIFVFLLLWVMYSIIGHVRDTENILAARYEEIKHGISILTKDALTILHVNLTKDEIEEQSGSAFFGSGAPYDKYSEYFTAYRDSVIRKDEGSSPFSLEALTGRYLDGLTNVSEIALVRWNDGSASFVKTEATLTKKPVSGDIVAFIVAMPYNEETVQTTLLQTVLMDEYDRIAYLMNGNYKVLVSNSAKKDSLLLSDTKEDTYESIYLNYILPAMSYDWANNSGKPNPLRLSTIENELNEKDFYEVDAPFTINGEQLYKHFSFYKINGDAKFYLMLLSDSTKIREAQEQRNKELAAALESSVRSNESRIRFFSNISHNLLTPMNGILGYADLAMKEPDPEIIHTYVEKASISGRKLLRRLNDLFTMSLIDSGTLKLDCLPTGLPALINDITLRFTDEFKDKGITFVADTAALENGVVLCDPMRLAQILERLLENSAAFVPEGESIRLSVSQPGNDAGKTCLFRISNRGKAIPRDVIGRIFDPDSWTENNDVTDDYGAGIGMSVAKAILDAMGGTASVRMEGEDEVVFDVCIPFELPADEGPGIDSDAKVELNSLRLLVVDDNEINREIAQLILSAEGYEIDLASDGAEAVDKIRRGTVRYDAVLMDIQMPVMNGYEATAAIRSLPDPGLASVPIVAMTANAYQEDQNAALKAGMNGYTPKPINPDEIRSILKKVLS
ncbi:MAG: response regulator [Clostridia bacterium]|nr:response regulator [Clostridia bacterium]